MKHKDKKFVDDFAKFLNKELFFVDGKECPKSGVKSKLFNNCVMYIEKFLNFCNPEVGLDRSNDILSIKPKTNLTDKLGVTSMTESESMKIDDRLKTSPNTDKKLENVKNE